MKQEWCPQHQGNTRNLDSLRCSVLAKPLGQRWATHTDLVGRHPQFIGGDAWHALTLGGSRDSHLERYLAVADDARLVVDTADGPKHRTVAKGGVVLAEALPDGTWRVSVPIANHSIDEVDDKIASS
jgi:hypothetical protein